ncbi:MAG TPA: helix-turn-helix domain-containing protein [bacterium]|nr:helix-turn-helix domain-containing protein [bacterium]
MVKNDELVVKLQEIGFNRLESEVYLTLLKQSPLTGYKIAQILGEGSSNIYKALDILIKKGAIMVEELPSTRQFTAVAAKEYMERVEKQIAGSLKFLEENLPVNSDAVNETRVFKLGTVEQVLERAVDMILNAQKQIVVDAFPKMLELIKPYLLKTAKGKNDKKVYVVVNSYDGTELKNCVMVKKSAGADALKVWKDSWLNMVVDGEKYLLAVISPDGKTLRHAVWTNSPFLSYVLYSGIASEMMFSVLIDELKKRDMVDIVKAALEKYSEPVMGSSAQTKQLPGFQKIMKSQG